MQRDESVPQAMLFEALRGVSDKAKDGRSFYTQDLYAVVGKPGLYRRVRREGSLFTTENQIVSAFWRGSVVHLIRDEAAEAELKEAGFMSDVQWLITNAARFGLKECMLDNIPEGNVKVPEGITDIVKPVEILSDAEFSEACGKLVIDSLPPVSDDMVFPGALVHTAPSEPSSKVASTTKPRCKKVKQKQSAPEPLAQPLQ